MYAVHVQPNSAPISSTCTCTYIHVLVTFSTVILAFVKSEGKKMDSDKKEPSETSPLINTSIVNNEERSSLMGSLKDKIVSCTYTCSQGLITCLTGLHCNTL